MVIDALVFENITYYPPHYKQPEVLSLSLWGICCIRCPDYANMGIFPVARVKCEEGNVITNTANCDDTKTAPEIAGIGRACCTTGSKTTFSL